MTTDECAQIISEMMSEIGRRDPGLAGELDSHVGAWYIEAKRNEQTLGVNPDLAKILADIVLLASKGV